MAVAGHTRESPHQDRNSWLGRLGITMFPVLLSFWGLRYDPDVAGTIAVAAGVYAYLIVFLAAENIVQFGSASTTDPGYVYYIPLAKFVGAIFLWFLLFDISVRGLDPVFLVVLVIVIVVASIFILRENLKGFAATYREEIKRNKQRQLAALGKNPKKFRRNGGEVDVRGRDED